MARIIQTKNGKTVIHTVGEDISLIPDNPNTYILGVDSVSGIFEKKNPNGNLISLEAFTGGTVSGATTFKNGLVVENYNGGIGTTIRGNANVLALEGSDHAYQEFYPQSVFTGRYGWIGYGSSGTTDFRIWNQPIGGKLLFGTENSLKMTINGDGNVGVGIGAATPTAKLHINNTTTGATFLAEDSSNPDVTPFIIDTNGNVGIGTANPITKLHVSGNTVLNGGLTATSISATTYLGLPNTIFTGGTVTGATTFTAGLTATSISATTYLGLPNTIFTGGTVTGATTFAAGLTATSISATTYYGLPVPIGSTTAVTYSEFSSTISSDGLNTGMLYIITDFQTCYDQPDFDYDNNPITSGNYKTGPVEPIIVLATSSNTISPNAYQPAYPNDRIQYDWSWSTTEVTSNPAYGRITERIDEYNNRTDYDHRNILFKRYRLFTIREDQPLNGTIEMSPGGSIVGVGTSFVSDLTGGDIICIPSTNPSYYQVDKIFSDTTMDVIGDVITAVGAGQTFYKAIEETNNNGDYFSFKRTNVLTYDSKEYTTFGDAIANSYAKNNYIGNYANNYTNVSSGTFILANNVFVEGPFDSNKFGNYCYNNTLGTNTKDNVWGDYCYQNVSTNDIRNNTIEHNFYRNLINVNLVDNNIGNDFNNNQLLAENIRNFEDNIIGNGFSSNTIYSWFYKNQILDNFNENIIGDFGNLTQFQFYRNYIRNNFNSNTIRQNFQNNQIGTNYQDNTINGESVGNTILNGFNNNETGNGFSNNEIGNGFNSNNISDSFYQNTTKYYFNNNSVSNNFVSNSLGEYFSYNNPSNNTLFGWNDLSTVSTRTYDTLRNSLDGNVGYIILGKELVMRIISTSQYFKIKFTQWTQNANGGGFQYTREELDSGGNIIGPAITFTKVNYGSEIDVIVPGVLEISRGNNGGIYNIVSEGGWNQNVSPADTEWNSIYTEPNNGQNFAYNKIGSGFAQNVIGNDFGVGGGQAQGNIINDAFQNNTIGQFMYNNVIGNYFSANTIGDNFENNSIKNYFIGNAIANGFEGNQVGNYFGQNGGLLQNIIFNDFKYNKIGNFFGNEFNFPSVGAGTGADGGNIINDGFQFNEIGDNCIYCAFDLNFDNNKIGNDFWLNVFGTNSGNNTIGNLFVGNVGETGFPSAIGSGFIGNTIKNFTAFNQIGSGFANNEIGNYFGNGGTSNYIAPDFNRNKIGDYFGDDGSATAGENFINVPFVGNEIGPIFVNNTIDNFDGNGLFGANKIGYNFYGNIISGYTYLNEIDHEFNSNSISDQFYSNKISSNFANNSVYVNFNNNIIESDAVDSVDFLQYVGNISTYTLTSSLGGTDSSYIGLTGTTNGTGINGTFDVVVTGGVVTSIVVNNVGQYYASGNTFVIDGSLISGTTITDDVTITIDTVTEPSVYGNYNCTIFKRPDGNNRLSFYNNFDVLNVKDINQ
jgi:hypothetical protein